VRAIAFAYLFAVYSYIQPAGFRGTYPTLADRIAFAHSFAGNSAIRLFYGYPYDPVTIGGYSAWRIGGTPAIAAAIFGMLAAVRALRTDEDAGRAELMLAGCIGRGACSAPRSQRSLPAQCFSGSQRSSAPWSAGSLWVLTEHPSRDREARFGFDLHTERLHLVCVHLLHPRRQRVRERPDRRCRREEADQQLETLLALPVSRRAWLGGRLVLAAAGASRCRCGGVLTWVGA